MPTKSYKDIEKRQRKKYQRIAWLPIRYEYLNSPNITLGELAKKYNISTQAIEIKCAKEKWVAKRQENIKLNEEKLKQVQLRNSEKIMDKITEQKVKDLERLEKLKELGYRELFRQIEVIDKVTGEKKLIVEWLGDKNLALQLIKEAWRMERIERGEPVDIIKSEVSGTIKHLAMVALKTIIDDTSNMPEAERLEQVITRAKALPDVKIRGSALAEIYDSLPEDTIDTSS
ncbi:MAG: hypothetical protein DDT23_00552 [candidate division WS2 bacterium]|nr:hypothetical protein [Candidatus Lithacetigena glycinireducens]